MDFLLCWSNLKNNTFHFIKFVSFFKWLLLFVLSWKKDQVPIILQQNAVRLQIFIFHGTTKLIKCNVLEIYEALCALRFHIPVMKPSLVSREWRAVKKRTICNSSSNSISDNSHHTLPTFRANSRFIVFQQKQLLLLLFTVPLKPSRVSTQFTFTEHFVWIQANFNIQHSISSSFITVFVFFVI